jgi:hypothetical protein
MRYRSRGLDLNVQAANWIGNLTQGLPARNNEDWSSRTASRDCDVVRDIRLGKYPNQRRREVLEYSYSAQAACGAEMLRERMREVAVVACEVDLRVHQVPAARELGPGILGASRVRGSHCTRRFG